MSAEHLQNERQNVVELKDTRPSRVGLRKTATVGPLGGGVHEQVSAAVERLREAAGEVHVVPYLQHVASEAKEPVHVYPPEAYRRTTRAESAPLSWQSYSAWRESKCPTANHRVGVSLEEYDQAVHEAVGEASEVVSLILENGAAGVFDAELRAKVLDEIGDCLFTFCWLGNVLGEGFGMTGPIEDLMPADVRAKYVDLAALVVSVGDRESLANPTLDTSTRIAQAYHQWLMEIQPATMYMVSRIGFFSNAYKKLRWQKVVLPKTLLSEHLFYAFVGLDAVAALYGTSLRDVALSNMDKINKRFPDGWKPGGGNR